MSAKWAFAVLVVLVTQLSYLTSAATCLSPRIRKEW